MILDLGLTAGLLQYSYNIQMNFQFPFPSLPFSIYFNKYVGAMWTFVQQF